MVQFSGNLNTVIKISPYIVIMAKILMKSSTPKQTVFTKSICILQVL